MHFKPQCLEAWPRWPSRSICTLAGIYNPWLVVLSVAVAIFVSHTALRLSARVARAQGALSRLWLVGGARAMGSGIWSMHFIGMLASHCPSPSHTTYRPPSGQRPTRACSNARRPDWFTESSVADRLAQATAQSERYARGFAVLVVDLCQRVPRGWRGCGNSSPTRDAAMYHAKKNGRSAFQFFAPVMNVLRASDWSSA
jgi:Bacterial signalling protein N terminal repeat